jgi:hypothetical protein
MKLDHPILTAITLFAMTSVVAAAEAADTIPPDDGFDPGLLFAALFFGAVILVLVGIGIIIGLVCVACAAVLIAVGVVSSSALIAILRRRFSAGFRALHYQVLALIAMPCGIGALWLGCALFGFHLRHRYILAIGSAIGILAGISIAYILDLFVRFVYRRFVPVSDSNVSV